jgi:hypothetical protein
MVVYEHNDFDFNPKQNTYKDNMNNEQNVIFIIGLKLY